MVTSELRSIFRICGATAIGFWVAYLVSCASPGITLFKLVPAQGPISEAVVHKGQVILSADYLDVGRQTSYLREKGYEALSSGLRQVPMVTFALRVRNDSDQEVIMDPGSIRLAVGYGPLLSPYNYAHLYMELPRNSDRQRILEDLSKAVFGRTETIFPGEMIEKLLLFKRPEMVSPKASVLFERLYVGGEETQAVLDFSAVDLER